VAEVQRYAAALGDEYIDKHNRLRSGEEWSDRLKQLIGEADIFQLFWSSNSMHSPFVRREWECALALGGPNFVRPCYWETPLPACPEKNLPPEELRKLHFQHIPLAKGKSRPVKRAKGEPSKPVESPAASAGSVDESFFGREAPRARSASHPVPYSYAGIPRQTEIKPASRGTLGPVPTARARPSRLKLLVVLLIALLLAGLIWMLLS
jgi:hypothetical protein